jgi:hypothetical protein
MVVVVPVSFTMGISATVEWKILVNVISFGDKREDQAGKRKKPSTVNL